MSTANFLADLIARIPFLIFILGNILLIARIQFMPANSICWNWMSLPSALAG